MSINPTDHANPPRYAEAAPRYNTGASQPSTGQADRFESTRGGGNVQVTSSALQRPSVANFFAPAHGSNTASRRTYEQLDPRERRGVSQCAYASLPPDAGDFAKARSLKAWQQCPPAIRQRLVNWLNNFAPQTNQTKMLEMINQHLPPNSGTLWSKQTLDTRLACIKKIATATHLDMLTFEHCCAIFLSQDVSEPEQVADAICAHVGVMGPAQALDADRRAHMIVIVREVHDAPRFLARAAALTGGRTSRSLQVSVENSFSQCSAAPAIFSRVPIDARILYLVTRLKRETLAALDARLDHHGLLMPGVLFYLNTCTESQIEAYLQRPTLEHTAPLQGRMILAAAMAQATSGEATAEITPADAVAPLHRQSVQGEVTVGWQQALVSFMRAQPSDAHRRVWTGETDPEFGEHLFWLDWPREAIILGAQTGQQLSAEELAGALQRIQHGLFNEVPLGAEDMMVTATIVPQNWRPNENVMLDERRQAMDESVRALLTKHPLASLPAYHSFDAGDNALAVHALQHMARQTIDFEIAGRKLPISTILRLVLASIRDYQHASGDAQRTETDRGNMRKTLTNNLASAVTAHVHDEPSVVCYVGLCERMVRALSGYDASVRVVFVTPTELINAIAGDVQKKRTAGLDAAQSETFMQRCAAAARDYYGDDAQALGQAANAARIALDYLRD